MDDKTFNKENLMKIYDVEMVGGLVNEYVEYLYVEADEQSLDAAIIENKFITAYDETGVEEEGKIKIKIRAGNIMSYMIDKTNKEKTDKEIKEAVKNSQDRVIEPKFNREE